jgi:hypothetical protein
MTTLRTKVNNSVLGYISNLSAGDVASTTMTIGGTTAGAAEFKGITTVSNVTDATSPTAAAFKVSGGAAVSLKLVVGGNGYFGDPAAGTGFAGTRMLKVANMINDPAAVAIVTAYCDRSQLTMGVFPRTNVGLPDAAYLQATTGGTGNGLFLTSTADDTGYVKLGVGSTAYTSPALTIKKSDSAASSKTTGAVLVSGDMGVSGDIWTTVLHGTATAAQYQDVAEKYVPDAEYLPGTVVSFGGEKEITLSTTEADTAIAGVISTAPAYMMGSEIEGGVYVALLGRVPCKVVGTIKKGDLMVSSGIPGVATSYKNLQPGSPPQGSVIGKALENYDNFDQIGVIEVVVGRV